MSLFKQKISVFELFFDVFRRIIEEPALFPNSIALKEQGDFSPEELRALRTEQIKLAIIYVRIYVLDLVVKRKIKPSEEITRMAYGQAVLTVANDSGIDFSSSAITRQNLIDTIDQYTMKIAENSDSKYDNYYVAFQHFQAEVFSGKKGSQVPIATITFGKYVREHVSKKLVDDMLLKYKITG